MNFLVIYFVDGGSVLDKIDDLSGVYWFDGIVILIDFDFRFSGVGGEFFFCNCDFGFFYYWFIEGVYVGDAEFDIYGRNIVGIGIKNCFFYIYND